MFVARVAMLGTGGFVGVNMKKSACIGVFYRWWSHLCVCVCFYSFVILTVLIIKKTFNKKNYNYFFIKIMDIFFPDKYIIVLVFSKKQNSLTDFIVV